MNCRRKSPSCARWWKRPSIFPTRNWIFFPAAYSGDRVAKIFMGFDAITAAARQGALLREGLSVVIAGKPNAGKSSLLNKLVGDEIAIVTDQPGTTRDVLRQQVHLDGLPVNLIDTAGLRQAADVVEAEGVRRAFAELRAGGSRAVHFGRGGPERREQRFRPGGSTQ